MHSAFATDEKYLPGSALLKAAATGQGNAVQLLVRRGANAGHSDDRNCGTLWLAFQCSEHRTYPWLQQWRNSDGTYLEWREPDKMEKERKHVNPSIKYRDRVGGQVCLNRFLQVQTSS